MDLAIRTLADMYSGDNNAFLLFARNENGNIHIIDDRFGSIAGLAILIELYARKSGISFSEAVERIRRTRLMEEVDYYIKHFVKEPE